VIHDLDLFGGEHVHTRCIRAQGYGSSYTLPIYLNGSFFGFLFFNTYCKHVFDEAALSELDVFGHMVSLAVASEVSEIRTLLASIKTASEMVHQRDFETGFHLDRMSGYAKLIAKGVADKYGFSDEVIEHIFLFSVLHDVGKIGIPDGILLKDGKLSAAEFNLMKTHALKGREIIDAMLRYFGLEDLQHIDVLRNIAHHHHEAMDGSGYPDGLRGTDIPIEARIVAVADVFDALTSRRPYKEPWSNDQAFANLLEIAGSKFDRDCVAALLRKREEVERIQERFKDGWRQYSASSAPTQKG
jgi:HD-GYP domain-containing protein (c-di-GMP phosphodiesterase class II)